MCSGSKQRDRAVALVSFGDEILAAGFPMGVGSEDRDFRADVMTRPQAARAQDVRRHRAGRRLAVHPRDDDAAPFLHQRGERLRAAHEKFAQPFRLVESRVARLDRGGINHHARVVDVARFVRAMELEPETLQSADLGGVHLVRPAHPMAEREQQRRQTAHARTGHADEMDPLRRSAGQRERGGGDRSRSALLFEGFDEERRRRPAGARRRASAAMDVSLGGAAQDFQHDLGEIVAGRLALLERRRRPSRR